MRTIIAGSRTCINRSILEVALAQCGWIPTVVICGCARGADQLGQDWAIRSKIPVERFPPDWDRYGKQAGIMRNIIMAENAEALIALWDGQSKGTAHMISEAKRRGLKVHIHLIT